MTRIYQTIIVTLALLFSIQGAQAVTHPPPDPDFTFSEPLSSGTYQGTASLPDADPNIAWFSFTLDTAANVSLDTFGSASIGLNAGPLDTILALYSPSDIDSNDNQLGGRVLGQNDDCDGEQNGDRERQSCLTFSNLGAATYLAGITLFNGTQAPFTDLWKLDPKLTAGDGKVVLNITVSAVPIPAAIWLFGTALIGFVGMSRRTSVKA